MPFAETSIVEIAGTSTASKMIGEEISITRIASFRPGIGNVNIKNPWRGERNTREGCPVPARRSENGSPFIVQQMCQLKVDTY